MIPKLRPRRPSLRARLALAAAGLGAALAAASSADGRVVRLVIEQRRPFAGDHAFGQAGAYERLDGFAVIEIDPKDPHNAGIVNLDKAPLTPRGTVQFTTPVFILKPANIRRGNGKIFFGLNNRGGKNILSRMTTFPLGTGTGLHLEPPNTNEPLTLGDANADNLLLNLGYAYVDAGWQGDVAAGGGRMAPTFPVALKPDGRPIVGKVRIEYGDISGFTRPLEGDPRFRAYEAADTDTRHARLTVRERADGPETLVSPDRWAFGRCDKGAASLLPTRTDICLFDGFQPDRLYDLTYDARDPIVMGLGFVATRDVTAYLRNEIHDDAGNPNPLARDASHVGIRRAYVGGVSQSGTYIREFIQLGFNADEAGRKAFDGALVTIAGTSHLSGNLEFADPNVNSHQAEHHQSPARPYPPFTYAVNRDPVSGITDGILKRPATDPVVIQVDSDLEFWQYGDALNVVDGAGRPAPQSPNARLYFAASFQHGGGTGLLNPPGNYAVTGTTPGMCQSLPQGDSWATLQRALLVVLDDWADRGIAPPPSNYPTLENGGLATLAAAKAAFPAIPGLAFPTVANTPELLDFGPQFGANGGRLTVLPPKPGPKYPMLVPKADRDGIDLGGIRTVEVSAPLGTMTGWNLRIAGHRPGELCNLAGSFVPFAKTRAERVARGDPRPSLEERYGDATGFRTAVKAAAERLVTERFLLPQDAARYEAVAAQGIPEWAAAPARP